MSEHTADVIRITEIKTHPNADSLELTKAFDYECVIRKGDFKVGDLAVFFHPETCLDTTKPEFAFLAPKAKADGRARIRVIRLRGEKSYGLLIPAPYGAKEGDNLWEKYNCTWYEPGVSNSGPQNKLKSGLMGKAPPINPRLPSPENIRKYSRAFIGEDVVCTVKLHGAFFRATYQNDMFYVGTHRTWRYKPGVGPNPGYEKLSWWNKFVNFFTRKISKQITYPNNSWWMGFDQNPWIGEWLKNNPDAMIMGELVGPSVQKGFHYGFKPGEFGVYVFAIYKDGNYVDCIDLHNSPEFSTLMKVPVVSTGLYDIDSIKELAEKPEDLNNCGHIREGIVVTRVRNIDDRLVLKYISDKYLEGT